MDDRTSRPGVAVAALALALMATAGGCGPRHRPAGPGEVPSAAESPEPAAPAAAAPPSAGGREILLGEMCPEAAGGRPGVVPVLARRVSWVAGIEDLVGVLERRWARQFSVFGWDGRRVGLFSVAGAAEVGPHPSVAIGSYAGSSPCQPPREGAGDAADFDADCVASLNHCGVAVAVLEAAGGLEARPFDEDPEPVAFDIGGACAADGKLLVEVGSDGTVEAYPIDQFLDSFRGPAEEIVAVSRGSAACTPRFASLAVVPPADPRDWRGLDVLAVVDLDADGRRELIVTYRYSDRRTWAVYSPRATTARLELVGEGVPWQAR